MNVSTEFEFSLPVGYIDSEGKRHRQGIMRLATAADEIIPSKDARVKTNPSYLTIILLSRVITKLGTLENITINTIENLFTKDFSYLQDIYSRLNQYGENIIPTKCPKCNAKFDVEVETVGES